MERETDAEAKRRGRLPRKRSELVREICQRIACGNFQPGSRLPTRTEFEDEFDLSSVTVQRAFDCLNEAGFVDPRGSNGTYVAERPPHLFSFALVMPEHPIRGCQPSFWQALAREASSIDNEGSYNLSVFWDVQINKKSADYQRLQQEVSEHRLGGIIFVSPPYYVSGSPILEEPIPHTGIMQEPITPDTPVVAPDYRSFMEQALEYLQSRGRRTIGVVSASLPGAKSPFELEQWHQAIAGRNLTTSPRWTQFVDPWCEQGVRNCVHLLMSHPEDRPDGLIIGDDNLLPHATAGLIAAGMRVPAQVKVVTHANFPWPTMAVTPVVRLGFDVRQILQSCIDNIVQQRQGKEAPAKTRIPAVFEHELKTDPGSNVEITSNI
ncbi:MAG: substrate-binding domain-containing protein [Candidatus Brocadiia bacterium]